MAPISPSVLSESKGVETLRQATTVRLLTAGFIREVMAIS